MAIKPNKIYRSSGQRVTTIAVKFDVDKTIIIAAIHYILRKKWKDNEYEGENYTVEVTGYMEKEANRKGIETLIRHKFESEGRRWVDIWCEDNIGGFTDFSFDKLKDKDDTKFFEEVLDRAEQWFPDWFASNAAIYLRRLAHESKNEQY